VNGGADQGRALQAHYTVLADGDTSGCKCGEDAAQMGRSRSNGAVTRTLPDSYRGWVEASAMGKLSDVLRYQHIPNPRLATVSPDTVARARLTVLLLGVTG